MSCSHLPILCCLSPRVLCSCSCDQSKIFLPTVQNSVNANNTVNDRMVLPTLENHTTANPMTGVNNDHMEEDEKTEDGREGNSVLAPIVIEDDDDSSDDVLFIKVSFQEHTYHPTFDKEDIRKITTLHQFKQELIVKAVLISL